ncbi:MAG: hypothetical protein GTO40_23805, partial [Deltaproteobacteria bacterium]|nr:hypothetical protein [Deltaproteobacteria bacterium]
RGFDYIAMAEEICKDIPSLQEVFVVGQRAGSRMTVMSRLLDPPGGTSPALESLSQYGPDPGDPAVFQLSGGTTGLPKVIPRTHNDYLY